MGLSSYPRRGHVYFVELDPTKGHEIFKTRPCLVVSPDELNQHLKTVIVAPMTTGSHTYPFRVPCTFRHKSGHVVLDQLRTVDTRRLSGKGEAIEKSVLSQCLQVLQEMFQI